VRLAASGHRAFLHRFQQGALRFGRRPVDFVGKHQIAENRPCLKPVRGLAVGTEFHKLRARDVRRHQIRCKLDA